MQACIEPEFLFDTLAEVRAPASVRSAHRGATHRRAHRLSARRVAAPARIDLDGRQGDGLVQSWLNIQRLRHGAARRCRSTSARAPKARACRPWCCCRSSITCWATLRYARRTARSTSARAPPKAACAFRSPRTARPASVRKLVRTSSEPARAVAHAAWRRGASDARVGRPIRYERSRWTCLMNAPTAIIAEDEPLLRASSREMLAALWPELEIARRGRRRPRGAAMRSRRTPAILFLDIEMPGITGLEVARQVERPVPRRVRDRLRPVRGCRLRARRGRLRHEAVLRGAARRHRRALEGAACRPARRSRRASCSALARQVAQRKDYLRWINAAQGETLRLITVDEICYFRADSKYTLVVTHRLARRSSASRSASSSTSSIRRRSGRSTARRSST